MSNEAKTYLSIEEGDSFKKIDAFKDKLGVLDKDINNLGKSATLGKDLTKQFDTLSSKVEETRKSFSSITQARLDGGQVNSLTKQIIGASERARQLQSDVLGIRAELSNPARKTTIAFLTDELRAAEREADALSRKLQTVQSSVEVNSASAGSGGASFNGKPLPTLRGYGAILRQVSPVGELEINAASQLAGLAGITTASFAALGAIAVAGAALVKVTRDAREESERRLKVEEQIQGAINNQILSQKKGLEDLAQARRQADFDRKNNTFLNGEDLDGLKRQRADLEQIQNLTPVNLPVIENGKNVSKPNEIFQKNASEIAALDARIYAKQQENQKKANDSFAQRWDSWKKSQEDAVKAEDKQAAALKKQAEDVEKVTTKVRELGRRYRDTFDDLFIASSKTNPFADIFTKIDRDVSRLKENLRGLPPELQAVAFAMQQKLGDDALFSARLDNKLIVSNLKDDAAEFRNYQEKPLKIDDSNKFFKDFIESGLKQISAANGGSFIRYNSNIFTGADGRQYTNGFSQSDARNDIFNVYERENTFGGFVSRQRTFADLTQAEKDKFIRQTQDPDGNNLKFQERLDRQLLAAQNSGALTDEQRRIVDRKLLSLTQGIDPSKLTDRQRTVAAGAREREAAQIDRNEQKAREQREKQTELQTRIAVSNEQLLEYGKTHGSEALIRLIDDRADGKSEMKKAPTAADVQKAADAAYTGGTFFGDYENN